MPFFRNVIITVLACLPFISVSSPAEDHAIFYGKQISAERFTVVEGGGYFPVLIQLHNQDLLAVVRGGDRHLGIHGRLDVVRSSDAGKTWSRQTLVDSPWDDRNPAVGQLHDGAILVSYIVNKGYGPHGEYLGDKAVIDGLFTMRSTDGGNTWEGPIKSPVPPEYGESPYGKIVQLPDGTALLAVYYGSKAHAGALVYRSKDDGQTWGDPSVIAKDYNETSLVVLSENRILAVMRSEIGGHLATAFSTDKGRTWSEPRQVTRDYEHPADAILLKDGRVLVVYGERNRPFGARAMLSRDLGQTWGPDIFILAADAQQADCGYPSSVEIGPAKIVTLYYGTDQLKDTVPAVPDLRGIYARAIVWTVPD
jgi:hypothetical protein